MNDPGMLPAGVGENHPKLLPILTFPPTKPELDSFSLLLRLL